MKGNPLARFLAYNNAVPVAISIMFLGAGATFAATDPGALYSADQQVVSVDNTYIVGKDLTNYSPRVEITGVTEDTDNYYVAYNFSTIDLKDSVWQDVTKNLTLTVSKADLGPYRDLGLYVTEQLKQKTDHELAYLQEVQDIERKNVTQKVVATTYGGLVGKFLDASTETLPGYTPVVTPPPPQTQVASAADAGTSNSDTTNTSSASLKIGLQLLGNNPAVIDLHSTYSDLGAVLIDPYGTNVGIHVFQDGKEVSSPTVDTSTSTSYTIEYRAIDPNGSTVMVRRVVLVGGAADPGSEVSSAGLTSRTPAPQPSAPAPSTSTENTSSSQKTQANTQTGTQTNTQTSSDAAPPTRTANTSSASTTPSTTDATTTAATSSTPVVDMAQSSDTSASSSATTTAQ